MQLIMGDWLIWKEKLMFQPRQEPYEQPPLFAEERNSLGLDTFFRQKQN